MKRHVWRGGLRGSWKGTGRSIAGALSVALLFSGGAAVAVPDASVPQDVLVDAAQESSIDGNEPSATIADDSGDVVQFNNEGFRTCVAEAAGKGSSAKVTKGDLRKITYLYCDSYSIVDISPLQYATNLTSLTLSGYDWPGEQNQISDLTPLVGLTKLEQLDLARNRVSDLTPLAGLVNLRSLRLDENQVSDLTPLAGLTNLTSLELEFNEISDISPLAGLTKMAALSLRDNQVGDVAPLAGLTGLVWVHLQNNLISDITPLAGLTKLSDINLSGNQVVDVAPLAGLTKLRVLGLSDNQIVDVAPLAALTGLTNLSLDRNPIADLTPLTNLSELLLLGLGGTHPDLALLHEFGKLSHLNLSGNEISDVSLLAGLTKLVSLDLSNNQISDVTPLGGLSSLNYLYLAGNQVTDISPLSFAEILWRLDVSNQHIELPDAISGEPYTLPGVTWFDGAAVQPKIKDGQGEVANGSVTWEIPDGGEGTLS